MTQSENARIPSTEQQSTPGYQPQGRFADVLTLGLATTACMWAVGYFCRLPFVHAPSAVALAFMLCCQVLGGGAAGRLTNRGLWGGVMVGVISATLNLLVLGSLLSGDNPNQVVPSALWFIPGSYLLAAVAGGIGAAIGGAMRPQAASSHNWTMGYFFVLACATLMLLVVGGLVTSYEAGLSVVDWPNSQGYNMFLYPLSRMSGGIYFEHAHRLIGSLVGLSTLIGAVFLQVVDDRKAIRRLGWLALLAVIVQGLLGGLRVTGYFTLSDSPEVTAPNLILAMIHGTLGQLFLCIVLSLLVFTSTAWRREHGKVRVFGASTDKPLSVAVTGILILQLVLGAIARHTGSMHAIVFHMTMAVIVAMLVCLLALRVWGLYGKEEPLFRKLGLWFLGLIGWQLTLGIAAVVAVSVSSDRAPGFWDAAITTLHQSTGAVLLALSVSILFWCHRLLEQPSESERPAESTYSSVDVPAP